MVVRRGVEVEALAGRAAPTEGEALVQLMQLRDGNFCVDRVHTVSRTRRLWLVVKDLESGGAYLSEGDVIKLGCFKFRVRQLSAEPGTDVKPDLRLSELSASKAPQDEQEEAGSQDVDLDHCAPCGATCRICLLEGSSREDPLVKPCGCRGSIEYVHLGCIRHWIKGRLDPSGTASGSYFYCALPCELCKELYPAYCRSAERGREPLVEVPKTNGPFVVLESMMRDTQQILGRGLHVLSLADGKRVTMGRGHDNDVRVQDVSTSRCHAMIRFSDGKFILEDNNSKFGTLVSMKKPRLLDVGQSLSIQAGRTVLSISAALPQQPDLGQLVEFFPVVADGEPAASEASQELHRDS
jgi:hypothetical protein